MARPYDRPATVVALVNAVVVELLPLVVIWLLATFRSTHSIGTTVVGRLPAGEHYARLVMHAAQYVTTFAPPAMAAAWRTFVHATRWLETGASGWTGILEAGFCGFGGIVLLLLPMLLMHASLEGVPYVLAYGILAFVVGLGFGVVLWTTATLVLRSGIIRPT